ncbi:MAG TPA: hypothetical protein VMD74_02955 [Candidatus Methylomirabilis sp.]|nr:hypothetical protein [Candidatus Methylomirabilis sp.]
MPNPYQNQNFSNGSADEDEPDFAATTADEDRDLEEDDDEEEGESNALFDLADEGDDEDTTAAENVSGPIFNSAIGGNESDADEELDEDDEDDLEGGDEDDEGDDLEDEEESAAEPALTEAMADEEDLEEEDDEDEDESDEAGEDCAIIAKSKIILARKLLQNISENSERLGELFGGLLDDGDEERISIGETGDGLADDDEEGGRVIEGVFNGENMIGPDGKEYSVPPNYASKSKLVEGDMLKLTITDRGTFVYKQTKPVERKRVIGKLEKDGNGNYLVNAEHKRFHVITASITYYKGIPGDKVVILIPVAGDSSWAAVENVIKSK